MNEDYEVKADFYSDWINYLKQELSNMGYPVELDESPEEISFKFFNVLWRRIPVKPRQLLFSREFSCPLENRTGLDILTSRIEIGEDLSPHLSTKVLLNPSNNDSLLNDWGIHHLHLGVSSHRRHSALVERTDPLLFARFDKDFAYLINIFDHGNWTNESLIQILHDNWPNSIKQFRVPGITDLEVPIEDRNAFRKAGVLVPIQIANGIVYMPPGGGYSASGTSVRVGMASDDHAFQVRQLENYVRDNLYSLLSQVQARGITFGNQLRFRLIASDSKFYVVEENSGARWNLN